MKLLLQCWLEEVTCLDKGQKAFPAVPQNHGKGAGFENCGHEIPPIARTGVPTVFVAAAKGP
jgi:hypothetical protein